MKMKLIEAFLLVGMAAAPLSSYAQEATVKSCNIILDEDFRSPHSKEGQCIGGLAFPSSWKYKEISGNTFLIFDETNVPIAVYKNVDKSKLGTKYMVNIKKINPTRINIKNEETEVPTYYLMSYIGKF